jgi:hypothetical protein
LGWFAAASVLFVPFRLQDVPHSLKGIFSYAEKPFKLFVGQGQGFSYPSRGDGWRYCCHGRVKKREKFLMDNNKLRKIRE